MSANYFYKLSSSTMEPCTLMPREYDVAAKTWLCTGCGFPKPGLGSLDVTIQEAAPDGPLNFISGCGLGIVRKEFLFFLGEEAAAQNLHLGRVFGPGGLLLDDWVSFNGHERIIVRGTKHAGVRVCTECGRTVYFAMAPFYLSGKLKEGISIFDSGNGGMVVIEPLGKRIEHQGWKNLSCTRLQVLPEPMDGLGDLRP